MQTSDFSQDCKDDDGLAIPKVASELGSPTQILAEGKAALERQTSGANWEDGKAIMRALDVGRSRSMREAGCNKPRGYKYCQAMGRWLRVHGFDVIRNRFLECFDHLDEIAAWREGRSPEEKFKLNYPPIVLKAWRADKLTGEQTGQDEEEKPPGKKSDLAVAWSKATCEEKARHLDAVTVPNFLAVISFAFRRDLEGRLRREKTKSDPDYQLTAAFRTAMSHLQIADDPNTSQPVALSQEAAALNALRGLVRLHGEFNDLSIGFQEPVRPKRRRAA